VPLYEDVLENVVISTFCTSESERRKEQNRNMEDIDFGCGEPCCGEPYLGFGRRMAVSRLLGCICCRASKGRVVAQGKTATKHEQLL